LIPVYAGHAADDAADGRAFAVVLALLIAWLTYQWWVVRRQDDREMATTTTPYFVGLAGILLSAVASIFATSDGLRVLLWGRAPPPQSSYPSSGCRAARYASTRHSRSRRRSPNGSDCSRSSSLGEVMAGVVNGLAGAEHSAATAAVGLLCLGIGSGIWWNYFDFIGLRRPRPGLGVRGIWLVTHLPLSMAVAATGAGMVSLIEHAADNRSPAGTAWLIGGSMALLCLCLAQLLRLLPDRRGARLVPAGLLGAALLSIIATALRPPPWALTLVLLLALTAVWTESFVRHARLGQPFINSAHLEN
jgi:hypothetical protein